jgi:hypothetical protein
MSPNDATIAALEDQLFGPADGIPPNLAPSMIMAMLDVGDGISDLIFSVGRPAQVEKHGELTGVDIPGVPQLTIAQTAQISRCSCTRRIWSGVSSRSR